MTRPIRVLFVDDEENIRSVLHRLFRKAPWESAYAASGEEALRRIAAEGPFDAVVTDQRMPGMSGVELLGRLRAEHPGIVRMVLSSYTDVETVLGAINEGFVYKFLTKPWKNEVLYQTVAEVVEALELRRENRRLRAQVEAQAADISAVDWLVAELEAPDFPGAPPSQADALLEAAPVGVLALGGDGTVTFANAEGCRLLGAEGPRALVGRPLTTAEVLGRPGLAGRTAAAGRTTVCAFWEG